MNILEFLEHGLLGLSPWQLVLVTLLMTHATIATVTVFLHRSQAHRALDLHPAVAHGFRFWLWLTTGMCTGEWVAVHRKHHARCETAEDPHSPQTRGLRKVLWQGAELYIEACKDPETIARYGHGTPSDWLERRVYKPLNWQGCALMLIIDVALFGAAGLAMWAVQMLWIPVLAAGVINGIGHFWGYRNFDSPDASTNIVPWGLLVGGEELHNNHHTYPTSAKLSVRRFEFDLGWGYIRILQALGLARVLRTAPVPRVRQDLAQGLPKVDLQTLQTLIANRYDLLARFAREAQVSLREELARLRLPAAEHARFAGMGRWLRKDPGAVPAQHQQTMKELLERSGALRSLVEMRAELVATWQQTAASREQMLAQLQDWIARAEASGNRRLEMLAQRIRSYQPVAA